MVPPARLRPLSDLLEPGPAISPDLTINIKSRGRWAVYAADQSMAARMLCPHALDFDGPAATWHQHGPDADDLRAPMALVDEHLVPVPLGLYGLVILDFDACQAFSLQGHADAFVFSSHVVDALNPNAVLTQGLAHALRAGHLPRAHLVDGPVVDLPAPPELFPNHNPMLWVAQVLSGAIGVDHWAILRHQEIRLPLVVPGWTFQQAGPTTPQAAAWLSGAAPNLHPQEVRAWVEWTQRRRSFCPALRAAARAAALGLSLPGASAAGRTPGGAGAGPRL